MWNLPIICTILVYHVVSGKLYDNCFSESFSFGVGTSSYQIEGAWNEDGKGENIFDYSFHKNPDYVDDKTNGDVACDFYHKWREDIQLIKELGVDFFRFSISWTRILPLGFKNTTINEKGVQFYSDLIDALLDEGIQPYVTIYHWDLPQTLQEKGGWLNRSIIDDYLFYAELLFELYGDRVKHWSTFNELSQFCEGAYSKNYLPPFLGLEGIGGYQCAHNVLIAHGKAYRLYEEKFKLKQNGKIGATMNFDTCVLSNKDVADRYFEFNMGWYANPIFIGDYPEIMKERIDRLSKEQGFLESRLPKFSKDEIELIKGTADFFSLNHYTSSLCSFNDSFPQPSFESDCGVKIEHYGKPSMRPWLRSYPEGLRITLNKIKEKYNNPPLIITENGWPTTGNLIDDDRIDYIKEYLNETLKAINEDNCNVISYIYWSFLDDFEWLSGYGPRFGLIEVDFNSDNRTRTIRDSYYYYKNIALSKCISN